MMHPAYTSLWLCPRKRFYAMRKLGVVSAPVTLAVGLLFSGSYVSSTTDADEVQAQTITTSSPEEVVAWQPWQLCSALMQVTLCPALNGGGIFTDFSFAPKKRRWAWKRRFGCWLLWAQRCSWQAW
jgi:hypothetical protein